MGHRSRFLGALLAATVSVAGIAAGLVVASPVSASTATRSAATELTGSTSLNRAGLTTTSVDGVLTTATVDTVMSWNQAAMLSAEFDPANVRQGGAVDPATSYAPTQDGSVVLNWSLNDLSVGWAGVGPLDIGTSGLSAAGACNLRGGGPDYVCHFDSDPAIVADTNPEPGTRHLREGEAQR